MSQEQLELIAEMAVQMVLMELLIFLGVICLLLAFVFISIEAWARYQADKAIKPYEGNKHEEGDVVSYDNKLYKVKKVHEGLAHFEPVNQSQSGSRGSDPQVQVFSQAPPTASPLFSSVQNDSETHNSERQHTE